MAETRAEELVGLAAQLGLAVDLGEARQFERFEGLLLAGNQGTNLTRIVDHREVLIKHFIDSLTCFTALTFPPGARVVDVGSGGGFPGIPVKIHRPDLAVSLLESNRKRCDFLRGAVRQLGLEGIEVLEGRAEDLGHRRPWREGFDIALARAVAHLAVLAEICLPLVKIGGWMVALKGAGGEREVAEAERAMAIAGGRLVRTVRLGLPEGAGERIIAIVEKVSGTPERLPRRAGIPQKRPLGISLEGRSSSEGPG